MAAHRFDIPRRETPTYLLFHKPFGVLSDFVDPQGRPVLADYIPITGLHEVGRLDFDSEGLLLLTDDGLLAHRLTHPRYHQPKTYLAQVLGDPTDAELVVLRQGVMVKGQLTAPAEVQILACEPVLPPRPGPVTPPPGSATSWLRLVLREGRKREVRHMTAAIGHPTLRLVRVAIGPLQLGDLPPGQWRHLTAQELAQLYVSTGLPARSG
jgi:23S rRNA pseudouridine2457 synthase